MNHTAQFIHLFASPEHLFYNEVAGVVTMFRHVSRDISKLTQQPLQRSPKHQRKKKIFPI